MDYPVSNIILTEEIAAIKLEAKSFKVVIVRSMQEYPETGVEPL